MLSIPTSNHNNQDTSKLKNAFFTVLFFVLILWFIELIKYFSGLDLYKLGVFPQTISGLTGIITAPLIHASFEHLISNTPALLILGTALLYGYPRSCWIVLTIIWMATELGVWLTARPVHHIGSSGLTYGMMSFIFIIGVLRRDRLAITLSLLVFFLYGTMIWGIFPHQPGVSFETHLWGGAFGVVCAIFFRKLDPPPPVKQYSWELEDSDDLITNDDLESTYEDEDSTKNKAH